ncbi:globin domain-containing protein [Ekhidna sp.]|uniref:globin domain-containing protein n=1 Tax=Ekhidna sp. TaxID=2608089 RepID=UPI00329697C6
MAAVLKEEEINLIDYSWEVLSTSPQSMMRFYDHLFAIAPETRHFFPDDISKQSEKLAYTIGFIVGNLERLETIKNAIEDIGRFHNKLQIEAYHYTNLKIALVKTIEENMEEKYHEDIGKAWYSALDYVSNLMLNAATKKQGRFVRFTSKLFH